MPELDTVRGIAVLGVLFLHFFYWQYGKLSFSVPARAFLNLTQPGGLGVNLFFVLSGLLITGILLDSKDHPHFYRRFYTRRALRILPAYYTILILLLLLRTSSAAFVGLSFIYLSNVTTLFGVACDYGPLWSLAVEEHFYILWPTVVRKLSARAIAWVAGSIMVVVPILRVISFFMGWRRGLDWYTWFVADGLAAGCLLAVVLRSNMTRAKVNRLCALLFLSPALAAVVGRPFGILTRTRPLGAALQLTLISTLFAGFILLVLIVGTSSAKRYVNSTVLGFFGYISYGLYLDHLLAFRMYDRICLNYFPQLLPSSHHFGLVVFKFVIAGGGAVAAAYLSRRFYEERFLRLKDSHVQSPVESAALLDPSAPITAASAAAEGALVGTRRSA
jgi:peptidoglycan/LPS O-acetylase OafA/YrhL